MIKKIINGVLAALTCSLMVTIVASCAVDDTPISAPQPTVVCNNGVFSKRFMLIESEEE